MCMDLEHLVITPQVYRACQGGISRNHLPDLEDSDASYSTREILSSILLGSLHPEQWFSRESIDNSAPSFAHV